MDTAHAKKAQEAADAKEPEPLGEVGIARLKKKVAAILQPGETVLRALKRLGTKQSLVCARRDECAGTPSLPLGGKPCAPSTLFDSETCLDRMMDVLGQTQAVEHGAWNPRADFPCFRRASFAKHSTYC